MNMNVPNNYNQGQVHHGDGDRFFFFPFLTGALLGGAAVAVARPRPYSYGAPVQIYQQPYPYPMYPGYGSVSYNSTYMPATPMSYGGSGYSYYNQF